MQYVSALMRDILIEHIDGPRPLTIGDRQARALRALLLRQWLRGSPLCGPRSLHPTHTYLTEKGRAALARLLGEYADALVRAGMGGGFVPKSVVERIEAVNLRPAARQIESSAPAEKKELADV